MASSWGKLRQSINLIGLLCTFGWFVGNGLDRSVLPCQKHDVTRKPRAIRRDFMRCARPDVRMGQDPSLQIFRQLSFYRQVCSTNKAIYDNLYSTKNRPFRFRLWRKLHLIYYLLSLIFYLQKNHGKASCLPVVFCLKFVCKISLCSVLPRYSAEFHSEIV